jgi:hypothetical protein
MRLIKIMLAGIILVATGFIFPACPRPVEPPPVEAPEPNKRAALMAQFKVVAQLDKTQYQVGEKISVKSSLVNMGERPVTVFIHGKPLFFRVYDADKREVSLLPKIRPDILIKLSLSPGVPYVEKWQGYPFTLEQPGRYKIVAWAELSLDENFVDPLLIYADPIWIEVVNGSN